MFWNKGGPVDYLVYDIRGMLNVPVGVHDGIRLEPGATERCRRHVGYRATIKIDYYSD